ncbi:MAG: hypothetical protein ACOVNR_00225 [Chitinophagaceae bacterium]
MEEAIIKETAKHKMQLYVAALFLFDQGKSYPQIVKILKEYEQDQGLLITIVDKAMKEEWNKLDLLAKELFASGRTKQEVYKQLSLQEIDSEIVTLICEEWYDLRFTYLENLAESSYNKSEALTRLAIWTTCLLFSIYIKAPLFITISISIALANSILQLIIGYLQGRIAKKLNRFFNI